jgi:hypothetical protein
MALTTLTHWHFRREARPKPAKVHWRIDWELWLIRLVHFVLAVPLLLVVLALFLLCIPLIIPIAIVEHFRSARDDVA